MLIVGTRRERDVAGHRQGLEDFLQIVMTGCVERIAIDGQYGRRALELAAMPVSRPDEHDVFLFLGEHGLGRQHDRQAYRAADREVNRPCERFPVGRAQVPHLCGYDCYRPALAGRIHAR